MEKLEKLCKDAFESNFKPEVACDWASLEKTLLRSCGRGGGLGLGFSVAVRAFLENAILRFWGGGSSLEWVLGFGFFCGNLGFGAQGLWGNVGVE